MADYSRNLGSAQQELNGEGEAFCSVVGKPERFDWVQRLLLPGQVVELCALGANFEDCFEPVTLRGYYDTNALTGFIRTADELSGKCKGVYWTLNPVVPELLPTEPYNVDRGPRVKDGDILQRRWLLVDIDPKRFGDSNCKGQSSTDAEKEAARETALAVRDQLKSCGWADPAFMDSGNGFHLLYAIDLPSQDGDLVKRVLLSLATQFDREDVTIDRVVYNPSRMARFYGTLTCKGENTPERPHRQSAVLDLPDPIRVVTKEQLEEVAGRIRAEPRGTPGAVAPSCAIPSGGASESVLRRARAYLAKIPPAIEGEGGSNRTFHAACRMVQGFNLSPEETFPLFAEWNETCVPPWSEKELRHKLEDAAKAEGVRGYLLNTNSAEESKVAAQVVTGSTTTIPSTFVDDPHRLADAFLEGSFRDAAGLRLRYWRGEWWQWRDGYYRRVADGDLHAMVTARLPQLLPRMTDGSKGVKVTRTVVSNVVGALEGLCIVSGDTDQPVWLGEPADCPGDDVIAVKNGILTLQSDGQVASCLPPTPLLFSPACLPMEFDPVAECPGWLAFLHKNLEGDTEKIALLQEFFGYCLLPDTSRHKFLMLYGEGCNGKSVVCGALVALLGRQNVSQVPFEAFEQRFALNETLGKLANIASEVGDVDKAAEGCLKGFTSGDRMMFDRKNKAPVMAQPTARLVLATNNLPRFRDTTNGIWRRLLLVPFNVQITDEDKVIGMDDPVWWTRKGELPGMLNWALNGLVRLRQNNRFTPSQECDEAIETYRAESNPVAIFVRENCVHVPDMRVGATLLRQKYLDYCKLGSMQPKNDANFGRELKKLFGVKIERKRVQTGIKREYAYVGLQYTGPDRFTARDL